MKKVVLLFFCITCLAQTNFTPSELEQAKLGKLKAQEDSLNAQMQTIDSQMQVLSAKKFFLQQQEQQKKSELLGYANEIIKTHKWEATYNSELGENGQFLPKDKEKESK